MEIHVWCVSLDQPVSRFQRLAQTLSMAERMRAERFRFEKDRKRFIACRGILRSILGDYLNVDPGLLKFCYGPNGKPAVTEQFAEGRVLFNLSHSNGVALFAITLDREIGVDIEQVRDVPEMEQIAERFFSVRENNIFRLLPKCEKKEAFFNCWTRKEAFIKGMGDGLAIPLNSFSVTFPPGIPAKLISIDGDLKETDHWSLQALTPAPGYVAAIAVEGQGWSMTCRRDVEY